MWWSVILPVLYGDCWIRFCSDAWKPGSLFSSFCFPSIIGAPKAKHYFFFFCEFLPRIYVLSVHQLGAGSSLSHELFVRRLWVKWQDWTVGCFAWYLSHWKPIWPSKIVCIIGAIPCLYCSWQVLKNFLLSYDTNAVWIDESLSVIYATVTLEHVRKLKRRSSFFIRFYRCLMLWSKKKNRLIKDSCY